MRYAGLAIAGMAAKSVHAWGQQEAAETRLQAALRSTGQNIDRLMPKFTRLASEMQKTTTAGDEQILTMMATLHNLGVMPDKMEEAAKGAIGLASALGLAENSAARYVALALQGEYTVLQRYVPALRTAETETEKLAVVNDLMARGWEQAQENATTTAGRYKQLSNSFGDLQESIGKVLTETLTLNASFEDGRNNIDSLSDTIRARSGEWSYMFRSVGIDIGFAFRQTWNAGDALFYNLTTAITNLQNNVAANIGWWLANWRELFTNIHKLSGNTWVAIGQHILDSFLVPFRIIGGQLDDIWTAIRDRSGKSLLKALSPLNNAVDELGRIRGNVDDIFAGIEDDLGIKPPEFSKAEYRNILDEAGKLEEDRLRRQSALEEEYKERLEQNLHKDRMDNIEEEVEHRRRLEGKPELAEAVLRGTAGAYSAVAASRAVSRTDEKISKNTEKTASGMDELVNISRDIMNNLGAANLEAYA